MKTKNEMAKIISIFKSIYAYEPTLGLLTKSSERRGIEVVLPALERKKSRFNTKWENGPVITGCRLFNSLPKSLREIKNLRDFKPALKTFLKYLPPTTQSLLDTNLSEHSKWKMSNNDWNRIYQHCTSPEEQELRKRQTIHRLVKSRLDTLT